MKNSKHSFEDRGNDLYETPPAAVRALMGIETLPRTIWEPACGPGAIVRELRGAGHEVLATDLIPYETVDQDYALCDFLLASRMATTVTGEPYGCIVTNPPFRYAEQFVRRALDLTDRVYLLLRLAFLESERRRDILDGGSLSRVHVFRDRLPMMHRDGWDGPKASSSMAFAWFVWDKRKTQGIQLNRVSWRDYE